MIAEREADSAGEKSSRAHGQLRKTPEYTIWKLESAVVQTGASNANACAGAMLKLWPRAELHMTEEMKVAHDDAEDEKVLSSMTARDVAQSAISSVGGCGDVILEIQNGDSPPWAKG